MLDFIIQLAFSVALGLTIILVLYYALQNFMGSQVSLYVNTCSVEEDSHCFIKLREKLRLY